MQDTVLRAKRIVITPAKHFKVCCFDWESNDYWTVTPHPNKIHNHATDLQRFFADFYQTHFIGYIVSLECSSLLEGVRGNCPPAPLTPHTKKNFKLDFKQKLQKMFFDWLKRIFPSSFQKSKMS